MEVLASIQSGTRIPASSVMQDLRPRIRARLADLATDEDREALHDLPRQAFEVADRMLSDKDLMRAAKLHETAVALALVLRHPMRHGNLASLDLARHFVRNSRGQLREVSIPAAEVKNKVNVRFELTGELASRLERHLGHFRPHIPGSDTTSALFPGANGRPREPQSLGRHIRRLVERQLGKRFHVHLARHLAVDIISESTGGNLRLAQKLLGHRSIKTTEFIYGGRTTRSANQDFQGLLREQGSRANAGASATRSSPGVRSRKRRSAT